MCSITGADWGWGKAAYGFWTDWIQTQYWNLVHKTIDRAKSTSFQDIIILGDLNNDLLTNNKSKHLQELIRAYNLTQLINEATHFTESSSSLIHVILVNKTTNILASDVCDPFIPNSVRFHCPVAVFF